jgi:hypothetical protein
MGEDGFAPVATHARSRNDPVERGLAVSRSELRTQLQSRDFNSLLLAF